jgi:hypothetical protein
MITPNRNTLVKWAADLIDQMVENNLESRPVEPMPATPRELLVALLPFVYSGFSLDSISPILRQVESNDPDESLDCVDGTTDTTH